MKAFSTASSQRTKQAELSICYVSSSKNDFFQVFKNANVAVNSVTSNVLAVSLSIDILARFVSLSSVIFDLWNILISLNLLKIRSAVLRTAVIGKISLEWPQSPFPGRPQKFFHGGNVEILLILFRLLTMQCKRTFTKRLLYFTAIITKNALRGRKVHCDRLQNRISADFSNRVLFYKEANCHDL